MRLIIGVLVALAIPAAASAQVTAETATVVHVVDGDTLDATVATGAKERVRILGINTPERGKCGYRQATSSLRALARKYNGRVVLESDAAQDDRDRYRRLLRYVQAGRNYGRDLGRSLVLKGWAVVYERYPVARTESYRRAQVAAQRAGRGIWGLC